MARLLALSSCVAVAGAATAPPTYFVSSSNPSAGDGNDGLSPATAWRTLQRAAAAAPTLVAGAAVLLRGGDVWVLNGAWFLTDMAGTSAVPITIGAYYDVGSSPDRPLLARNASLPAAGPTLTINNSSGIIVSSLAIRGGENGIAFTFDVRGGQPTTYDSITVTDCFFDAVRGLHYDPTSGSWWGSAVALAAAHSGVTVTNVVVSHNLCNGSDTFYYNSVPYSDWTRAHVSGLLLTANAIVGASYNTIFLDTTDHVLVSRNVLLRNTPAQLFQAGTTDIIMGSLDASNKIVGNEIGWRGEYQPGGPDGCAIDFETNANGVEISSNYIHHSFGAGIMVFGHDDDSNKDLVIANNTMLWNGCNQTRDDHGGIAFMHLNSSGAVTGNVMATCPGTPLFFSLVPHATDRWTISGNTIDGTNGTLAVVATPAVRRVPGPAGAIVVTASCVTPGAVLRYTTDGSRPTSESPQWPSAGQLSLPPRAVAVVVKAFPGATAAAAATAAGVTAVESPADGAIFGLDA